MHLDGDVCRIWIASGIQILILVLRSEPGSVQAPSVAITSQHFQHVLLSWVASAKAGDSPSESSIVSVGRDDSSERANGRPVWQPVISHQSIAFDLCCEVLSRTLNHILETSLSCDWRKQIGRAHV